MTTQRRAATMLGQRACNGVRSLMLTAILIAMPRNASAVTVFTGATGGISFGVAPLGPPVSPGAPTYLANNFNLRNDILANPGLGLTAFPTIPNNTSSTGVVAWAPGQFIFNAQAGGGNVNGPFGSGAAVVTGPNFNYRLSDGGIPGGVSTSYEILTWDAGFTQPVGAPVGTIGTFITMGGTVPFVQDLALVSLRTQLIGNTIGAVELPGLILAIERTGALTYNTLALQDNGIGGVTPMPGGFAILVNPPTGAFRALAFNVLPDLGAIDGFSIPTGEVFTARVTATIYADPASMSFIDPLAPENLDLLAAAVASNNTPFPVDALIGRSESIPEPASVSLAVLGLLALLPRLNRSRSAA